MHEISIKSGCSESSVKQSIRSLLKDVTEHLQFRILSPDEKQERYGRKIGTKVRIYRIER